MEWAVERIKTTADDFHRRLPADDTGPQIWIAELATPALILGSTQSSDLINRARAEADGYEVCGRRSGGGIVHVDPAHDCWIDVIVPRASALWSDDVGKAFHWLGQHWADTLAAQFDRSSPPGASPVVHRSGSSSAGALWCFAGIGHGEVTIEDHKVVGLSQRRTRHWIRLQGLVIGRWPGADLDKYLAVGALESEAIGPDAVIDPALIKAGPPPGVELGPPWELTDDFLDGLPEP